ncbi:rhodanese-like domain-containing protein [Neolewinella antarctica]|uniref:Rhodanese-related sulfurtransferase n=1 Tax=Neolewinella antarctica TaxID=442734 RepID=A0ABX0XF63_9BACT|nr:rhodanese-like domain-containing protein [Neolewinella antarctica]NJC27531.1 rhodanese-related sulfurtransferase [Neolewinella antarctica]
MPKPPVGPPACPIPRWQLLKRELVNVSPQEFDRLRESAPAGTLIDVRAPTEYAAYHLDGAVNLNYLGPDFLEEMDELDATAQYLVYCRSGRRSVRACTLMRNAGFTNLIHLDGGINAYEI